MRKSLVAVLLVAMLAGTLATAQQGAQPANSSTAAVAGLPPAAVKAMNSIDADRIRVQVQELSSDKYEGRGTGQPGGDKAAQYIAAEFKKYGLKPAGDKGTFIQNVPMVGIATEPSTKVQIAPEKGQPMNLTLREDIVAMDESQNRTSHVEAPIVFVGYGIQAPEYKWNDYKDVDVKGKILLMLVNEPPSEDDNFFKGKALTYYGRWTYKFEQAARMGAVGALIIHQTDMASYGWNVVQTSWSGERSYLRNDGKPKLKIASWITGDVAQKLAAFMGTDVPSLIKQAASPDFMPVPVPATLTAHMVSTVRPFESANVIAMVAGSDPKLKNEAVLYSAHYDHLGVRSGITGDNIYNGAIDNATGIGILLEMARAFSVAQQKPKRSIYFAAVTAEEQGLRGSEWLGLHPPVPAGQITLGLNFDGLAPIGVPEEVEVTGADRTTFYPTLQEVAQAFNFKIMPDSNPGAGFFYRSDHFSLARVGVPAFSVNQGDKYEGKDRAFGENWGKEYTKKDYHQPSDEFKSDWDFKGNVKMARFGFALGWKAANQPELVAWKPGDEFEAARQKSLSNPKAQVRGTN